MTDATTTALGAGTGATARAGATRTSDGPPPQKWPPISEADADAIGALTDPAFRNLKITQAYHDLKIALAHQFGPANVTWCAYATWASKTAGSFIRAEEVPALVREYLAKADHLSAALERLNAKLGAVHADAKLEGHSFLIGTVEAVMRDVTADVGRGNLLVFQELAPLYAKWLRVFGPGRGGYDPAVIEAFVKETFTPGPVESGGQDLLVEAFRTYYEALHEPEEAKKAQQMFLANALVGYHEQVRLQQPILSSLNAPLVDVFLDNAKAIARGKLPHVLHGAVELLVEDVLRPVAARVEEEWHQVSTRWMMTLSLPGLVLSLGEDVPGLSDAEMFPSHLREATYEPLLAILSKLDRTPNTVRGSAARDWGLVDDRMNYIVDLFRSRQQDASLYEQPFTDEQVALIRAGTMPGGKL